MIQCGGGAGCDDPVQHEPELVAKNAREGYVSHTISHNVYGVVLNASGDVDVVATRLRRQTKASARPEEEAFEFPS